MCGDGAVSSGEQVWIRWMSGFRVSAAEREGDGSRSAVQLSFVVS